MNKKIVLLVVAVVVCGTAASYLIVRQHQTLQTVPAPQPSPTASSAAVHEPMNVLAGGQNYGSLPPFVNTSTGATVTFKEYSTGANNLGAYVYLDGEKIDKGDYILVNGQNVRKTLEVGGEGSDLGFSPDNKFFAFRTRWGSGCCASDFAIFVMDIGHKTISQVNPPRREADYSGPKESPTQSIFPFIEEYTWDNDALRVTFYFVEFSSDEKYYRVSPKEIWRYDLATGQYTLLETLSESSTSSTP
jgi:hypothetical protein